jgi:mannan endo-1,4-beta-mannosidase
MRAISLLLIAVLAVTLCTAGTARAVNTGFVGVNGTHFELGGSPYYYAGASFYNAMNLAAVPANRSQLDAAFGALESLGVRNVRVWASSEGAGGADKLTPTLQPTAGSYDETMFAGLDYALKSANDHNLRLIMVLNNSWDWSGGMNEYVDWSPTTNKTLQNLDWGQADLHEGQGAYHDQFYTDDNCQATYRAFIDAVVNRANTQRAGLLYRDDPTVFSWELANEPRAHAAGQTVLSDWIGETADYIRSLDTNHMVSTGSEGFINQPATGNWWDNPAYTGTDFLANHAPDNVDFASVHIWPWNWRWYPEQEGPATMEAMYDRCVDFLQQHIDLAGGTLGKPLVLEEFGLLRDGDHDNEFDGDGSEGPGTPVTERDALFSLYFDLLYGDADNGGPSGGSNFWTFDGDPPQEPEGMYSVYDPDDTTTLAVIAEHAAEMNSLVPEPASFALLAAGVLGLLAGRRPKR